MADIRRGDVVSFGDGVAEVLQVTANNEGGVDLLLRYAGSREELSNSVYRKGGPDERDDDREVRYEDYEDDDVEDEESEEDDESDEDDEDE